MDTLRTIAGLLPLAQASGINFYATILVAGLSIHFGWVQDTPASLKMLDSGPVLVAASVFYLAQFFAGKIQFIDNLWDLAHTFIRPLGAAMMGVAVLGEADSTAMVVAALAAGGIALASHGGKAGTRVALNVLSPAENATNIALSTGEDLVAAILTFIALKYPLLAICVGIAILVLMAIFVPQLVRWAWFVATALVAWVKRLGQRVLKLGVKSDYLPPSHMHLLHHQVPGIASQCQVQGIKGANGRTGFVSVVGRALVFTHSTWRGSHVWYIGLRQILAAYLRHRTLMDVLEVYYQDDKHKERRVQFAFKKDRALLAERLASKLMVKAVY